MGGGSARGGAVKPPVVHRKRAKGGDGTAGRPENIDEDDTTGGAEDGGDGGDGGGDGGDGGAEGVEGVEVEAAEVDAVAEDGADGAPSSPKATRTEETEDPATLAVGSDEWLAARKKRWRALRDERKRRRDEESGVARRSGPAAGLTGVGNRAKPAATGGMGAFYSEQASTLHSTPWQLLTLQEGATPGELSAWVLLGSQVVMVVYIDR